MARVGWSWVFSFPRSVRLWLISLPWKQDLLGRTNCSLFQMVPFFLSFQKPEVVFLQYLLWECGQGPGGKSHHMSGHSCDWVSLELWLTAVCLHWASSNSSILFRFSTQHGFPWNFSHSAWTHCIPLFLQSWVNGRPGVFFSLESLRFQKNWWYFRLSRFSLVRMEWQLPSLLHEELETRSRPFEC